MKFRNAKIKKVLILAVGCVIASLFLLLNYKERSSYCCQICFAQKDVIQWRVGSWGGASIPLTPSWERITETQFSQDFFPSNHVHDWKFAQGSPYYFFGTTWGGCAIGSGRHISDFCQLYEIDPEFRTFVQGKLRDGSISKTNIITSPKDADALVGVFVSRNDSPQK